MVVVVKFYFQCFILFWFMVYDFVVVFDVQVMGEWVGFGYYVCVCNLLVCVCVVLVMGGFFDMCEGLGVLLGIGFYILVVIVVIVFGWVEIVVDGNVECVVLCLFVVEMLLFVVKFELVWLVMLLIFDQWFGDFVQVMMDLGVMICILCSLVCGICLIFDECVVCVQGIVVDLFCKLFKKVKLQCFGMVWIGFVGDCVLVEICLDKGLLGGMLVFFLIGWDGLDMEVFVGGDWWDMGVVCYVFMYFMLDLMVLFGQLIVNLECGNLLVLCEFSFSVLFGLMCKVWLFVKFDFVQFEIVCFVVIMCCVGKFGKNLLQLRYDCFFLFLYD